MFYLIWACITKNTRIYWLEHTSQVPVLDFMFNVSWRWKQDEVKRKNTAPSGATAECFPFIYVNSVSDCGLYWFILNVLSAPLPASDTVTDKRFSKYSLWPEPNLWELHHESSFLVVYIKNKNWNVWLFNNKIHTFFLE